MDDVALVTGAGSGIGRAVAATLAAGKRVILVSRDPAALAACAAECGPAAAPDQLPLDLTADDAPERLREAVEDRYGHLDVLVHSAGAIARGTTETLSVDELDRLYRINLRAPYAVTRALLPLLKRRCGQVVFINSTAGLSGPPPGLGAYGALKHALRAYADALRAEVNAAGVRVLSVFPGRTATPMQRNLLAMEGRAYDPASLLQPQDVAAAVAAALAMPRTAEVTELRVRPMRGGGGAAVADVRGNPEAAT